MRKIFLLATLSCFITIAALAQDEHSNHQNQSNNSKVDTTGNKIDEYSKQQLSQLLNTYYNIKNALVTGDASTAATNADLFLKTANTIDFKVISEGNLHIITKDAGKISNTRDLKKQREFLAGLSANMASVAEALPLSDKPIYLQYCPMKKATWLSSEKQIRNPYYGSSMLTCGEIKETF